MTARSKDINFQWTPQLYDAYLDTVVIEKVFSGPYFKEWGIREIIQDGAKWHLISSRYPSFLSADLQV